MSIFPDNENHVTEWLTENKSKWINKYPNFEPERDPYPPRSLYGIYLEDVYEKGLLKAKEKGISVELVQGSVVDVQQDNNGVMIKCDDGKEIKSDKVVLALGNFPSTTYKELQGKLGYFPSFWSDEKTLASIPKDAPIVILGTRLTAIDAVLTLLSNGYNKVTLASRSGLLPKVQAVTLQPVYKDILLNKVQKSSNNGQISLDRLVQILKEQIEEVYGEAIDWSQVLNPAGAALEIIEKDIEASKNGNASKWQSVLASTSNIIETFWNMLTLEDRTLFLQKYMSIWYVYRHAIPLKNGEKIFKFLKNRQLEICSGVQSVKYDDEQKTFIVQCANKTISTSYIINATEAGLDIAQIETPLIQNLLKSGLFKPSKYGGIDVDLKTSRVINQNGEVSEAIYTIGYLTRGVHFYTNDVGRIAIYAKQIVSDLLNGE